MTRANNPFFAVCMVLALGACDARPPPAAPRGEAVSVNAAEYLSPPEPRTIEGRADGAILAGIAPAGSRVRLATPQGEALFDDADTKGAWRIALGPLPQPRVFGLSVTHKGRQAQAQGYVLVEPGGRAALLRAGAAAARIDRPATGFGLRAVDFDREGAAVVSAMAAAPGAAVGLWVDDRRVADGRASASGEVELAVPTPLTRGLHRLQVYSDGRSDAVAVQISSPAPLVQGPLHSQLTPAGLRADWMTPGGGMQSTILIH